MSSERRDYLEWQHNGAEPQKPNYIQNTDLFSEENQVSDGLCVTIYS